MQVTATLWRGGRPPDWTAVGQLKERSNASGFTAGLTMLKSSSRIVTHVLARFAQVLEFFDC